MRVPKLQVVTTTFSTTLAVVLLMALNSMFFGFLNKWTTISVIIDTNRGKEGNWRGKDQNIPKFSDRITWDSFENATLGSRTWHCRLNDSKIKKKNYESVFEKIANDVWRCQYTTKRKLFFNLIANYVHMTSVVCWSWMNLIICNYLEWKSQWNRSVWLSETLTWISTGVGCCFAFIKNCP